MKLLLIIAIFFLVLFGFIGCSTLQKIETLKPEPDEAKSVAVESETSFINVPVTIKIKDIESQMNKYLTGLIYNDSILSDDNLEMKIWKQAPIRIMSVVDGKTTKIKTVLPLKVQAKYRYGFDKMGIQLYDYKEFNLNGIVTVLSDVGLTNWQLKTNTTLQSLEWSESPSIVIAGKNVPITYIINPTIRIFKSKIEKTIDTSIKESLNFKPQVLDALDQLATPFELSETYESWLRLVPIEVYSKEATVDAQAIQIEMGLKCLMETFVGNKPEKKFEKDKVILKPVSSMPDKITANIIAVSTYADASKIMTKNFNGQTFGEGSRKVKVINVNLWHKKGKMIIALEMSGSINGTIYLSGFPQYNAETKEIYFDQLDYVLDTKGVLTRTANWLAQGYVLRKIQESCRYSIKPNLEEGKQNVLTYLNNYSPIKGVFLNGDLDDFEFRKIQLTNEAIIAYLKTRGQLNITIDGME
ncbi:DUF4403 family protein [Flavobacterium orientale]|uniref:DUF4403 family protein n=1 Tax=Flavobacterium orientale TaxID=1756020 RepID=A0A917DEH0_9FLAO|nr:DUF4403 family protein [Flavobacterium orientale]GGD33593.1 hypothetical protein GCM10011343_24500 [Flavobacterium orientale]